MLFLIGSDSVKSQAFQPFYLKRLVTMPGRSKQAISAAIHKAILPSRGIHHGVTLLSCPATDTLPGLQFLMTSPGHDWAKRCKLNNCMPLQFTLSCSSLLFLKTQILIFSRSFILNVLIRASVWRTGNATKCKSRIKWRWMEKIMTQASAKP